jgi:hypothetical protein
MGCATYYTLFVFNKETSEWEDVFGAPTRNAIICEGPSYFGERKRIMKNDGTLQGLRRNYVELGQPLHGLEPSNGALVLRAEQFPHEGDKHLWTVLCEWNGEFVVWSHNTQDGGCYHGSYFDSRWRATEAWEERKNRLTEVA